MLLMKKIFPGPSRWTALSLYYVLGISKLMVDSILKKRTVDHREIRMIMKAFVDGWLNRKGKTI